MLVIVLVMLVVVVVAGLVVAFAAFPHRGEELPAAPWLGDAMTKAADAMPTLGNTEEEATGGASGAGRGRGDSSPLP